MLVQNTRAFTSGWFLSFLSPFRIAVSQSVVCFKITGAACAPELMGWILAGGVLLISTPRGLLWTLTLKMIHLAFLGSPNFALILLLFSHPTISSTSSESRREGETDEGGRGG